jgi:GNAT superfamily N-acetyltransferase
MTTTILYRDDHKVDLDQLARLRAEVGWAALDREVLTAQLVGSRWVVSAWDASRLVGVVRAISDGVTNAYVCGLVVDEHYRRRGIGTELIQRLVTGREEIRWILHAAEAPARLYRRLGFLPAENMMRRDRKPVRARA